MLYILKVFFNDGMVFMFEGIFLKGLLEEGNFYDSRFSLFFLCSRESLKVSREPVKGLSLVEMQMDNVRYVVEGIIIPPISLVGLVGNTLTIVVLNHNDVKLKRSLVDVLCGLATFDNLFLISIFPLFTMPSLSNW